MNSNNSTFIYDDNDKENETSLPHVTSSLLFDDHRYDLFLLNPRALAPTAINYSIYDVNQCYHEAANKYVYMLRALSVWILFKRDWHRFKQVSREVCNLPNQTRNWIQETNEFTIRIQQEIQRDGISETPEAFKYFEAQDMYNSFRDSYDDNAKFIESFCKFRQEEFKAFGFAVEGYFFELYDDQEDWSSIESYTPDKDDDDRFEQYSRYVEQFQARINFYECNLEKVQQNANMLQRHIERLEKYAKRLPKSTTLAPDKRPSLNDDPPLPQYNDSLAIVVTPEARPRQQSSFKFYHYR